jgi:hypothetical protein
MSKQKKRLLFSEKLDTKRILLASNGFQRQTALQQPCISRQSFEGAQGGTTDRAPSRSVYETKVTRSGTEQAIHIKKIEAGFILSYPA